MNEICRTVVIVLFLDMPKCTAFILFFFRIKCERPLPKIPRLGNDGRQWRQHELSRAGARAMDEEKLE